MLYNTPDTDNEEKDSELVETKAVSVGSPSAGSGTSASGKSGGEVQEVRQAGLSLRRRQRTWSCLLSFGDLRARQDAFLLCLGKAKETNSQVSRKLPETTGAHRTDHVGQSGATRARGARRRLLKQLRGKATLASCRHWGQYRCLPKLSRRLKALLRRCSSTL
jgi:hypothetical protein